jgi:hypothetical protein
MALFNIEIQLVNGIARPDIPASVEMHVNDTVRYFCNAGDFEVRFESGSPFDKGTRYSITDSTPRTLIRDGTFFCKCFITIGWSPDKPQSGGDHDVKP